MLTCLSGITLVAFAADLSAIGVSGEGTADSPFIIDTADKFVAVFGADATTTATTHANNVVIYVTEDIDLSSKNYTPSTAVFQGTLQGVNADTLEPEKRTINIGTAERTGVDAYISSSATKNVVGGVLNSANAAEFSHFIVRGTLTATATDAVGGFMGYDDKAGSTYSYIDNYVTVSGTATQVGGVVGFARSTFDHCSNNAAITNSKTSNGVAGGIVGAANSSGMYIDYCVNYGNITGTGHTGGIIGSSYQSFRKCANFGYISGKGATGGIIGYHSQNGAVMQECFNAGTVKYNATGTNNGCGSLVGRFYFSAGNGTPSRPVKISDCYNIGKVIGTASGDLPYCTYAACVGDVQGTGGMKDSSTQYSQGSIAGYYDLANENMPLYSVYNNLGGSAAVSDAYVISDANGANTATFATMKTLTSKEGSAFADEAVWEIDATADYKFPTLVNNPYDNNLPAIEEPEIEEPEEDYFVTNNISGAGTNADPYIIDNAAKFNAIFGSANTNWADTKTAVYHITADIDLTTIEGGYTPWSESYSSFQGKILGKDASGNNVQRTIKIGTVGSSSSPITGIPGTSNTMAGGLLAWANNAEISYLTVEGTMYANCKTGIGGVLGYIDGTTTVSNVINKVNVTGNARVAGIVGTLTGDALVFDCTNEGTVTNSGSYTGGIIGYAYSDTTIEDCINNGAVSGAGLYLGGIVGMTVEVATISGCTNNGAITSTNPATSATNINVGGIVGEINYAGSLITDCHNNGNVTANSNKALRGIGGIVGWLEDSKIFGCSNTGNIYGGARVGGIAGYDRMSALHDASTLGIHNSWNSGTIDSVTAEATGGLTGFQWLNKDGISYKYTNNYNTGTINDTTKSGSAIGAFYENTANWTIDFTLEGFYDTTGYPVVVDDYRSRTAESAANYPSSPVLTSTYVYMGEGLQEGAVAINKTDLIGLPVSSDTIFTDAEVWTQGNVNYPYPQIVDNPYTGHAVELPDDVVDSAYTVENIAVYYDNGTYKITWTAESIADSYELHYGDDQVATVTLNGDITSIIKNKELEVQVYAVKGSSSYPSEATTVNGYFGGGSGVEGDEYLIYDAEQFANIENKADAYYKQMEDFTVTTPLFLQADKSLSYGNAKTWFEGNYNGNNKTITVDFTLNNTGDPCYALFTYVKVATIENLNVAGTIHVEAAGEETFIAGIVGSSMAGGNLKITNCNSYVDITSNEEANYVRAGGIMGISYQSSPALAMKDCNNYGNISGKRISIGGVIYRIRNREVVENCANYGNLTSELVHVGGIVGQTEGGTIKNCFNMGNLEGTSVAGITPYSTARYSNMVITDCFNAGTLTGTYTTGIAREVSKYDDKAYSITNCYNITSAKYPVALKFTNSVMTVTNCYFVDDESEEEGAVKLADLPSLATLGDAFEVSGTFPYPQLKSAPIDADKAGIEYVKLTYNNDGNASIDKRTSEGYIVKGSEAVFYVESKDADFNSITIKANDVDIDENIIEEKAIKLVISEDTVIYAIGVALEVTTPVIETGTNILASTDAEPITIGEETYERYAISAGRAPKFAGVKLKEFGVLINNKTGEFDITNARAKAQGAEGKISDNGAYGILIYSKDADKGIKDNKTYYTRPYAIYTDKDGVEYTVYGEIQSFVLTAAPADAE